MASNSINRSDIDLRQSAISIAENANVNTDLRNSTIGEQKKDIHNTAECPGHFILNGVITLGVDDPRIFAAKTQEIQKIMDSVMPDVGKRLNDIGINFNIQFGNKIGMVKCKPVVPENTQSSN